MRPLTRLLVTAGLALAVVGALVAGPAGAGTGTYAFVYKDSHGRPAHWDACRTIRVRINPHYAPSGYASLVSTALAKLHSASGLHFTVVGTTTFVPYGGLGTRQSDADLVIAWSNGAHVKALVGKPIGTGGVSWVTTSAGARITRGQVVLDTYHPGLLTGFVNGVSSGALLLHELGHAVGLAHVSDSSQIMYPDLTSRSKPAYQSGDRTGLARIGTKAGCF